MLRLFSGPLLLLLSAGATYAQDVSHCVEIADPDDRLNCYDDAFVSTTTAELPEADWDVTIETSRFDDSTTVFLSVDSVETITNQYGQRQSGHFYIRCEENTTSAFFTFGGYFMSDLQGRGRVDYRVDERPAQNVSANVSTSNTALGLWRGRQSIPFLQGLFGGGTLIVRATPFSDSRIDMEFNITGIETAITPLRDACNW